MEYAETNPTFDPRWAIYASGPDQAYLDAQVQRLREAAPGMGLTHEPAMTWGEIVPGTGADRPERDDVLRSAESRQFSYLLVVSPSQLSQDIQEFAEICRRISRAGVVYHFLDRSPFDSPYYPVLMDLMAVHEKRMFSQRIKQGLEHAAKRGSLPGGTAPFGYDRDLDTKSWRVNPVEAPVVMQMFEMAAAGMTPGEIAQTLNEQGIQTRTGRRWTRTGVRRILKNETLTGMAQCMGVRIGIIPIITREIFERVQRLLGQHRTKLTPKLTGMVRCGACERDDNAHLLTGILWCGLCGDRMTSTHTKDALYYRCRGRDSGCNPRYNSKWGNQVWSKAKDLLRDPIGTVEAIRKDNGPITQQDEQRITDWCRQTAPLLDGMDNSEKREVLRILGVRVTVEDSSESIQIRLKPHLNPDGDGTPPATS